MYITVNEDGEIRAWKELTDEELNQFLDNWYVVVEVPDCSIRVIEVRHGEKGELVREEKKVSKNIDGYFDP